MQPSVPNPPVMANQPFSFPAMTAIPTGFIMQPQIIQPAIFAPAPGTPQAAAPGFGNIFPAVQTQQAANVSLYGLYNFS